VSPADAITGLRFVAVPALFWCAWHGRPAAFLAVLGIGFLSDVADGWVARRLGQTSERGARLDTAADVALFATVPICGSLLWPDVVRTEAPFLVVLVLSYAAPIAVGLAKYGPLHEPPHVGRKALGVAARGLGRRARRGRPLVAVSDRGRRRRRRRRRGDRDHGAPPPLARERADGVARAARRGQRTGVHFQ
jgi:hypothetical protein